jgi:branched-chain amino acid aminotransferase
VGLVYVNGSLVAESDAKLSVFDHGLVVGDGVFETILLTDGHPFALTRHLRRLARSAMGLGIAPPPPRLIEDAVSAVVEAAPLGKGRIRVTLTSGTGPLGSGRIEGPPSLVVAIGPMGEEHDEANVAVVPFTRNEHGALTGLKTTSYGENALALAWANARGADEAIFANTAGAICEGTGSNVFYVLDGVICTPTLASGCLAGVTRALVMEQLAVVEVDHPISLFSPDGVLEAFLTSTLRGVQPIAAINGEAMGISPGPLTMAAAAAYMALLANSVDP